MKLRLPSILLSALVAAQMCTTANADTVVASGVFYDVGKESYSSDPNATKQDSLFCWATAGANMVQYWQDSYGQYHDQGQTPPSGIGSSYNDPYGTSYLKVYQEALKVQGADKTGYHTEFIDWWFKGTAVKNGSTTVLPEQDGYYNTLSDGQSVSARTLPHTESTLPDTLKTIFSTQGQLAGLSFRAYRGAEVPMKDHAITCMGYETGADGKVSALILADADDAYYGAIRVNVSYDQQLELPVKGEFLGQPYEYTVYVNGADNPIMSSDDINYDFGKYPAWLYDVSQIVTPENYTNEAGEVVTVAQDAVHANTDIANAAKTTTSLEGDTKVTGQQVAVGNGSNIVVLTTDNGEKLSLDGMDLKTTGLKVRAGSLASLENVSVTGYADGGIDGVGHTAFHDGSLSVTNNTTEGNGAGATNASYMEISGNTDDVVFSDNKATGANSVGGGIENKEGAVLSIRGNKTVNFSGNSATKGGNDIYNAGTAIVADNKSVVFASSENGKAAVTNDGTLYLANKKSEQTITFDNATLDSSNGTTYIGKDNRTAYDSKVTFTKGSQTTTIDNDNKSGTPATLDKLSVSADEIIGTSAKASSVTGANIVSNGDLLMKSLTLDASDTIKTTSGDITMTNTVIKLKDFSHETEGSQHTFDLSGLTAATGTLTLNNVVFDTTGMDLDIGADDTVLITFAPTVELTDAQLSKATGTNLRGELRGEHAVIFHGDNLAPEPATATLSLLALAALAARRKRH